MSEQTLKLYESLTRIGFDADLAETVSKRIMSDENAFATKSDFTELRTEQRIITARLNILIALNVAIFASILIELVTR